MGEKKTILIIEDEEDTRYYFTSLLEDNGFNVVTACDGAEGIARVEEQIPDLITLDMSMPERSGVRFYRDLKGKKSWENIPVIIVTGLSESFESFISSRHQVPPPDGYLSKPIHQEQFLTLIDNLTK